MKKLLLTLALMAPVAMLAKEPSLRITPEPLPEGITSVAPIQGFVEVAGSVYPQGVSNIGVNFPQDVEVNEANTTEALLYFNDFSTPADKTLAASVDQLTLRTGGVIFKGRSWNKTGIYKIVIPEGYWIYTDSRELSPAMTLYYEIYIGYNVLPTPGVVEELQNIVLTFWEADEVRRSQNAGLSMEFYKDNSEGAYACNYEIMDYNNDGRNNQVVFSFGSSDGISQTFIEPGVFGLRIDAGFFEYIVYGPNYPTDPEDFVKRTNEPLLFKYNIPNIPMPEIDPAPFEPLEAFTEFTLWMPDRFTKWFTNDRSASNIYAVNENGVVDTSVSLCRVRFVLANNLDEDTEQVYPDRIVLNLFDVDTNEPLESFTPADGLYCLRLADGLFSGEYASLIDGVAPEFVNSSAFDYYYEIKNDPSSGVEEIESMVEAAGDLCTVYTLSGICVARNADVSILNSLKPGLYIVNEKKVIIK